MNSDKQIEEMVKLICNRCLMDSHCAVANSGIICDDAYQEAEALKNAGYRKASDVVKLEEKLADVTANWQKIHDAYDTDCIEHYNKGRSDVAREIFEEIESIMAYFPIYGHSNTAILNENDFAELKKKYIQSEDAK